MKKKVAGPAGGVPWTPDEIALLRRKFPTHTNKDLAAELGRGLKSIIWQGAHLGLSKTAAHRSRLVKRTSRAYAATVGSEVMAERGRAGGVLGGVARAERLSKAERSAIAAKGGSAPRRKRKPSVKKD